MRRACRVCSIVLILFAQTLGSAWRLTGGQVERSSNITSAFSQLKAILSRLYPVEHWTVSIAADAVHPLVPRFCWEFFRADPDSLSRLGNSLRNYKGNVSWVIGPPSGSAMCIVAMRHGANGFVGYPPIAGPEDLRASVEARPPFEPSADFIDRAVADIPSLCSYLEQELGLKGLAEKLFDPRLVAPPEPPSSRATPFDFVEPGMHVAWIVKSGSTEEQEHEISPSNEKYMLHFGVREAEWRKIHTEILDRSFPLGDPTGRRAEPASFPLLSRIEETESVYFPRAEVEELRQECLRARSSTSDALAIRGLDKLIFLCAWARSDHADILLRAP